ncbi:MAG: hypothetical protein R3F56_25650 [Planctomycetota bacterium]
MAEAPRKQTLKPLLEACCWSIRETLGSLVGKRIEIEPKGFSATSPDEVASRLRASMAVVRGKLDKMFAGKTVRFMCEAREATTLAGAMMMTADEVLAERRKTGLLEGEELEAFSEVANVLCSGIDSVLRERLHGEAGLRLQDHATLAPAAVDTSMLGEDPLYELSLTIQVEDYAPTKASIFVDRATGDRWNGGPVEFSAAASASAAGGNGAECASDPSGGVEEDDEPAAPIRGRLAAFLVDGHTTPMLRRACRSIGLELDKRPRGEVPNPAANRDAVIFIEVPPSDDRRFDWCRRIKTFSPGTKVALLLGLPSRHQVLRAARAGADVVLGHPIGKELLVAKLGQLLEPAPVDDSGAPTT